MKKSLMVLVLAFVLVMGLGIVAYAGSWEITSHYLGRGYSYWDEVQSFENRTSVPQSYSYTHSSTAYASVNAEAGLSDVVQATVGVEAGASFTDSYTFNVTVPVGKKTILYCRWVWDWHYGYANYYQDSWNPFDGEDRYGVYWEEFVPDYLDGKAEEYSL